MRTCTKLNGVSGEDIDRTFTTLTRQPVGEEKAMNEPVRWVTKAEAAEELEVSLSTLDRKIRTGEVEVLREGRRVYVRMVGEYTTDEEVLRRAIIRQNELERTVRELERQASEADRRASELEQERDEAREAASAGRRAHHELKWAHEKEIDEHKVTNQLFNVARVVILVLLVVVGLLTWRLFA